MEGLLLSIYNNVKIIGYISEKYHRVVNDRILSDESLDPFHKVVHDRIGHVYYHSAISIQTHLVMILDMNNMVRFPFKISCSTDAFTSVATLEFLTNVSWLLFLNSVDNNTSEWQQAIDTGRFQEGVQQFDNELSELSSEISERI